MKRSTAALSLAALSTLACGWLGKEKPPPPAPPPPPPAAPVAPTAPARTERTGPVDDAHVAMFQQSDSSCDFFVQTEPGDKVAPVTRLAGKCPSAYQIAWATGKMAFLSDDRVVEVVDRKPVPAPDTPFPPTAIAWSNGSLIACGASDAESVERDGTVRWNVHGKSYELPTVPGATGYALVGRWHLDAGAWKEDALGGVALDPKRVDAPCTALGGWPVSEDRLDPDASPTLPSPAFTDAAAEDLDGGLTAIAPGAWRTDTSRTLAVHGQPGATGADPVEWEGPVALWTGGKWVAVPDTQGELSMSVAPDWLLVDRSGTARLVSRRDGTVAWTDDVDLAPFLWPSDLPVPPEKGEHPPKRDGDARTKKPEDRPKQPTGHRPGTGHGGGGKGDHQGQKPGGGRGGAGNGKDGKRRSGG